MLLLFLFIRENYMGYYERQTHGEFQMETSEKVGSIPTMSLLVFQIY